MDITKHIIRNAYDAYWFIHNHPAFQINYRSEDTITDIDKLKKLSIENKLDTFTLKNGQKLYYEIFDFKKHALNSNLDICYSKVDKTHKINKDLSLNNTIEVWLEFGPYQWLAEESAEFGWPVSGCITSLHDIDLDCGGPTFDDALIILARLIKKKYGDYTESK